MGEAVLVDLHLAEDGDDRHEQPGVLERQQRVAVRRGLGDQEGERCPQCWVGGAVVAGEPGVGDVRSTRPFSLFRGPLWNSGGVDGATWAALTATLTLLGLAWTWVSFQRRGTTAAMRALGFTLMPVAAYLTGTLEMFTEIAGSVTDWASSLVFNPATWIGIGLAGFGVVLIVLAGVLRDRQLGRAAGPPDAEVTGSTPPPGGPRGLVDPGSSPGAGGGRRDGRDRGAAEEARDPVSHAAVDGFVERNRLWARLGAAVANHPEPLSTPIAVVDLDAFDANADDLARGRVANRSVSPPSRFASRPGGEGAGP